MEHFALGIDLGTTNTCAFVKTLLVRDSQVVKETIAQVKFKHKRPLLSSVFCVSKYHNEIELLDYSALHNYGNTRPRLTAYFQKDDSIVHSVKSFIGKSLEKSEHFSKRFGYRPVPKEEMSDPRLEEYDMVATTGNTSPTELSAILLREVWERAMDSAGSRPISTTVITVPTYFGDRQRRAVLQAASMASIPNVHLVNEPTAAAISYLQEIPEESITNCLVFDMGGGTLDISTVTYSEKELAVKSTAGNNDLGGDRFDGALVEWFVASLAPSDRETLGASDDAIRSLFLSSRKARETLSYRDSVEMEIIIDQSTKPSHQRRCVMTRQLTRRQFEQICESQIELCLDLIDMAIDTSGLGDESFSAVLLAGGSSRMQFVTRYFARRFPTANLMSIDQDTVVGKGACIFASKLLLNDLLGIPARVKDVISLNLNLQLQGHIFHTVVNANTMIPHHSEIELATAYGGQKKIWFSMYESTTSEMTHRDQGILVGRFSMELHCPDRVSATDAIHRPVMMSIDIDHGGIVKITVTEGDHQDNRKTHIINHNRKYIPEELDDMLKIQTMITDKTERKISITQKRALEFALWYLDMLEHIVYRSRKLFIPIPNAATDKSIRLGDNETSVDPPDTLDHYDETVSLYKDAKEVKEFIRFLDTSTSSVTPRNCLNLIQSLRIEIEKIKIYIDNLHERSALKLDVNELTESLARFKSFVSPWLDGRGCSQMLPDSATSASRMRSSAAEET